MMTCQKLTELVTEYLEGKMSFGKRLEFRLHVSMCPPCRRYLKQMKSTVRALGHVPDDPIPDDVRDDLLDAFRSWKA